MTRVLDWAFSCHTPFIYGVANLLRELMEELEKELSDD